MKKIIFMVLAIGVFTFTSCSKDEEGGASCEEKMNEFYDAQDAFLDDSSANCERYADAISAVIEGECASNLNDLEMELDAVLSFCDNGNGNNDDLTCEEITSDLSEATNAYANDPVGNCAQFRDAIEAYIDAQCEGYEQLEGTLDMLPC